MAELLQVCITSFISFLVLFLIAKLIGHRQISQLNFFDYITGITIGSIAAEMATNLESPEHSLAAMLIFGILTVLLNLILMKSIKLRKLLSGHPLVILDKGMLYRKNMKKAKLDLSEFIALCRQQGYFDLSAIQTALFEFNGQLTILPKSNRRPATPQDLTLLPVQEFLFVEVILDGRIMKGNLSRVGIDEIWLNQQLKIQGFHSAEEVFCGICDQTKALYLFPSKQ